MNIPTISDLPTNIREARYTQDRLGTLAENRKEIRRRFNFAKKAVIAAIIRDDQPMVGDVDDLRNLNQELIRAKWTIRDEQKHLQAVLLHIGRLVTENHP